MKNENNLQVTFSKRRAGVFKKVSELCTLCGVDAAIVVFSPGRKVFSFGHPTVETVLERFLSGEDQPGGETSGGVGAEPADQLLEAHRSARVRELSMELTHIEGMIELEKKRSEAIGEYAAAAAGVSTRAAAYDQLGLNQLTALKNRMEILLKQTHSAAAHQLMVEGFPPPPPLSVHYHPPPPPPPPPFGDYSLGEDNDIVLSSAGLGGGGGGCYDDDDSGARACTSLSLGIGRGFF
ncbi:hypothetical protein DM860_003770 [Cuscuta australis]|uniref:MADS-box domain-containing protein n=1 Tax=Cuscuta australis TaxID=267555 RepID=A0A328DLG9_9ASTE|nr:hypothetical protein DM860_003770 [Cuscuta australis]